MPSCTLCVVQARSGDIELPAPEPDLEPDTLELQWRPLLLHLPHGLDYVPPDDVTDEDLKCCVCLEWPIEPVVLACPAGHMLCRACAGGLGQHVCPVDRQPFACAVPAQPPIMAILDRLSVRCVYWQSGCKWVGPRKGLMEHCTHHCREALEECRECGAQVRRCERDTHMHLPLVPGSPHWVHAMLRNQLAGRDGVDIVFRLPDLTERTIRFVHKPLGLYMYMEKPFRVKSVTSNSQAERLGIRHGWMVVKIDEEDMLGRNVSEMHMLLITIASTLRTEESVALIAGAP
mmetsp:Transcript_60015/g.169198  ORF Transcript_60015/g.169198 Transcript_60015/m.169198 type:complete len:289 (-) Transcript_60015:40-906(-)